MATVTKGKTFINGDLVTPAALHQLVDSASVTNIANGDLASDAAIADTKLATIATAGKVANSATTATPLLQANTIVRRDAAGNFDANIIGANITGTASNVTGTVAVANGGTGATSAPAARTNLGLGNSATLNTGTTSGTVATGDHTHAQLHDRSHAISSTSDHTAGNWKVFHSNGTGQVVELPLGTAGQVLTANGTAAAPNWQTLSATTTNANNLTGGSAGTIPYQSAAGTTAMLSAGTSGQVLRSNGAAAPSWDSFGTSGNTANAVVQRDGFGNFAAGTITANLTGNVTGNVTGNSSTATSLSGTVAVGNGGTGATNAPAALTNLGAAAVSHSHGNITTLGAIGNTSGVPIITGTSGVLQAGSFGTAAGTYCQGNDSRLSDARTPAAHSHGSITTLGAIGNASGVPIITGTSGVLQAGSFGTTAGTFCQGNDPRLSDARTPTDNSVTTAKLADGSVTTAKLASAQQVASAWCSVDGDIPTISIGSGAAITTFSKVSDTVVRVNKTAHGLLNGDYVCFDALASPNNYLNGTWIVSGVTSNQFDFTISGAIVPASPTAQIIKPTRIKRKYNVSKVGRLSDGNYRVFFESPLASDEYIVVGSALYAGDPRMGVGPVAQTSSYVDVRTSYYNGTEYNVDPLNVVIFGGF
jgi:hypothetical protein